MSTPRNPATDLDSGAIVNLTRRNIELRADNERLMRDLAEEQITSRLWSAHYKRASRRLGQQDRRDWQQRLLYLFCGVLAGAALVWLAGGLL